MHLFIKRNSNIHNLLVEGEMTNKNINVAAIEARRFLKKIAEYNEACVHMNLREYVPSKYRAAIHRASMDLTRALAEMRQGR